VFILKNGGPTSLISKSFAKSVYRLNGMSYQRVLYCVKHYGLSDTNASEFLIRLAEFLECRTISWRQRRTNRIKARSIRGRKTHQDRMKYDPVYAESWRMKRRARYHESIHWRISQVCRKRINRALKGQHVPKPSSSEKLIGCSWSQLKLHIEQRFSPGMSWGNYGYWHIDHILPCDSFDLSNPAELRKCFHFSNLQPLWAAENISKSNKVLRQDLLPLK
jgi:hypothetical protein